MNVLKLFSILTLCVAYQVYGADVESKKEKKDPLPVTINIDRAIDCSEPISHQMRVTLGLGKLRFVADSDITEAEWNNFTNTSVAPKIDAIMTESSQRMLGLLAKKDFDWQKELAAEAMRVVASCGAVLEDSK